MIFGIPQSQQQEQVKKQSIKKPRKISTNNSSFIPTMSNSIPFPIDEIPARHLKLKEHELDLNDPSTYRPRADGIHVRIILQQAILTGWLTKHRAPTFSFMKNIKKRYVVLVDRMLYTFKSETAETYREFLELTINTNAFVTDQFSGALYCIEIKKKGVDESWFLQADNAETMKIWLDRIKRTISLLREGHPNTITKESLSTIKTEEEEYSLASHSKRNLSISSKSSSSDSNSISFPLPPTQHYNYESSISSFQSISEYSSIDTPTTRRQSSLTRHNNNNTRSSSLPSVLPPQLPPPKSELPPIPSYAYL